MKLTILKLSNVEIERVSSIRFLGMIIDQSISIVIEIVENEISKNIGTHFRISYYSDRESLKNMYFPFIRS